MTRRPNTALREHAPSATPLTVAPREESPAVASAPVKEILVVRIADQRYALPIDRVREVQRIVAFSGEGFGGPVVGMVDLRGSMVPAIDARDLLALGRSELSLDTQMVMLEVAGEIVALLVDAIDDVMPVQDSLRPLPRHHALSGTAWGVAGFGDEAVPVLHVESMLADVGPVRHTPRCRRGEVRGDGS